jgi:hypothetical protein
VETQRRGLESNITDEEEKASEFIRLKSDWRR